MMKNTFILGDSYSTFADYIPAGYKHYYSVPGRPETDVRSVTETWWYQVAEQAGLNIVLNDSWSGSTIGYLGYNNEDCSRTSSFIPRLNRLIRENFFAKNKVDTIFLFGGTNDSWADIALGEMQYENHREEDLYFVLPAICYLLRTLKAAAPKANIYCMINTDLKPEITECFEVLCQKYSITPITFPKMDKKNGHPTIQGMRDIAQQVLKVIHAENK